MEPSVRMSDEGMQVGILIKLMEECNNRELHMHVGVDAVSSVKIQQAVLSETGYPLM